MNTKHTLWSLCEHYTKIEIPIIQRDYAQGRETQEVKRIRKKFINDYLIESILMKKPIELDFVYGSVLTSIKDETKQETFIPLDGQQRLTTLFLLHWFVALKEKRVLDAKENLSKFTYETRPSTRDFCTKLIEIENSKNIKNIRQEILDSEWYDDEWDNDPTVVGMLTMIHAFTENKQLMNHKDSIYDSLVNNELVSFYFTPLEEFGLTENLYIRMNARGKMLTDFENFKSEFYKIISIHESLLEEVKDKMEYAWVENLWDYREDEQYIVDKPFMQYLSFITEMLYYKNAKFRAKNYESDFIDFKVLKQVYSIKENLKFFIFALDSIKAIKNYNKTNILWTKETSIHDIFMSILGGKRDITQSFILFSSLNYLHQGFSDINLADFLRVVRNLINNTADNSRREWPKLLKSLSNLISERNVYEILLDNKVNDLLDGFYVPQRKEEILKAKIINSFSNAKKLLFTAEDDNNLEGNISVLIISNYVSSETNFIEFDLEKANVESFDISKFESLYSSYKVISKNDFNIIWGDILTSTLYTQSEWSRLTYNGDYAKHPAIILFAVDLSKVKIELHDFLILKQKSFIKDLYNRTAELSNVNNVKEQLYLYFILHSRIMKKDYSSFFKNGYNFGWLSKEIGYASIFDNGIIDDHWFSEINPIFQTYKTQFRYNLGLKQKNALDEEIIGKGRKNKPFELLINWANE